MLLKTVVTSQLWWHVTGVTDVSIRRLSRKPPSCSTVWVIKCEANLAYIVRLD